jgi:cytochrome c oxidase subunit III
MVVMFAACCSPRRQDAAGHHRSAAPLVMVAGLRWLTTPLEDAHRRCLLRPMPHRAARPGRTLAHGTTTTTGLDNRKIAIWAFIGSECMLFASLISTYLIYKGRSWSGRSRTSRGPTRRARSSRRSSTSRSRRPPPSCCSCRRWRWCWRQQAVQTQASRRSTRSGADSRQLSKLWLWRSPPPRHGFLGFQAYEFTAFVHEGLTIRTNLFGSSFFTLTGFHGAHVTVGVLWLWSLLAIDYKRGLGPSDALNVDMPRCTGTSSTSCGS